MIIAHLPAGYVSAKLLFRYFKNTGISIQLFIFFGILGAVAPDFDMFYFYLFDNRQNHHHTYWPHYPIVWLVLLTIASLWLKLSKRKSKAPFLLIFSICGFVHILLDTIVGDVWWFAPFVDKPYALFNVPAIYKPWWLNFILHWTFALEIFVLIWSFVLWRTNLRCESVSGTVKLWQPQTAPRSL